MYEIKFNKLGDPSKELHVCKISEHKDLKPDEVLIEVLYFPINPADLLLVEGKYSEAPALPSKIGAECIAKVKKLGPNVKKFNLGDIVLPLTRENWVSEIIIKEDNLIKLNKNIDLQQASMLKVNPATAYLMLNNYINVNKGDYIIQNAANSGVGNYIIQLSKIYGIKTINLVRRKNLIDELIKLGADHVYDINNIKENKDFIKKFNSKLFIDAVAGPKVNEIISLLPNNCTIINYGLLSGKNIAIDPHYLIFKNITLKGFWLSLWLMKMSQSEKENLYSHLADLIITKKIFTKVQKIFHITEINRAVELAGSYNRSGKVLVSPNKSLCKI